MTYTRDFDPERCCEECDEIVHNHFNCPICQGDNAGTTISCSIFEYNDDTFACDECHSIFRFIDKRTLFDCKIELVEDKHNKSGV